LDKRSFYRTDDEGGTLAQRDAHVSDFAFLASAVVRTAAAQEPAAIRALRFVASGNVVDPNVRVFVQLAFVADEYETGIPSPLYDAFVEYVGLRDLNVRLQLDASF
jgi:hypothetical protein